LAREREKTDPDEPLTDEVLGPAFVAALSDDLAVFAKDEASANEPVPRKKITRALRDVVTYRLWADLKRGWRITMPNLEQTGQLRLSYLGIDELAANDDKGAPFGAPLVGAEPDTRAELMHVLLDELRRNLCIESEFLTEEKYDSIKRSSQDWLKLPWALTDETGVYSGTAYPGGRPSSGSFFRGDLYVSGRGLYGRWLRRPDHFPLHDHPLSPTDAATVIEALLKAMADAGILVKIREGNRRTGYRIQASLIKWRAGDGEHRAPDPIRGNRTQGRVNPFFRRLYAETAQALVGLEAREHTAQVEPATRQEREQQFSRAKLSVLYCSPTMELGVDIKASNPHRSRRLHEPPVGRSRSPGGQPAPETPGYTSDACPTYGHPSRGTNSPTSQVSTISPRFSCDE